MVNLPIQMREWILAGGVLVLTWAIFRVKKVFRRKMTARHLFKKHAIDLASVEMVEKFFTMVTLLISGMLILQIFGLDIMPLLTLSGIGAAVLGLASRDVIANFFGGLMVYMTSPFAIGDYIELPDKKIAGFVEEIGWYHTTIRDKNKRCLYLPNAIFSTETVLNQSRFTHFRIDEVIRIRSDDGGRAEETIGKVRELLAMRAEVDQKEPIDVFLLKIGAWGFEFEIKAYILSAKYEEFMQIQQEILLEIHKIAYQTVDVRT